MKPTGLVKLFLPVLLVQLLFCLTAPAQKADRQFYHYTTEQGLSNNTVTHLLQDSRGFLWFSSQDGLNRYDGYTFKTFRHIPGDSLTLSGNYMSSLTEDHQGNLWIGTLSNLGLNRYDRKTGHFSNFKHDPENPNSPGDDTFHSLTTDKEGYVWIATWQNGVDRLDPRTRTFTHFKHNPKDPNSISTNLTAYIYEGQEGDIWVGTVEGLNRLNKNTGRFTRYLVNSKEPQAPENMVISMVQDQAGRFWLGTMNGIFLFDQNTGLSSRPAALAHIDSRIFSMVARRNGEVWFAGVPGVYILDRAGKVKLHQPEPDKATSISDKFVTGLLEDNSGIVWMGTYNSGISKYDPARAKFPTYHFGPSREENPNGNSVIAVAETSNDEVWVSLRTEGLRRYNRRTGKTTTYHPDPKNPNSPASYIATVLYPDGEDKLWIGYEEAGLDLLDLKTGKFTHFEAHRTDPNRLSNEWILSIAPAGNDALWIGTNGGGLNKLDKKTGRFTQFRHNPKDPNTPGSDFIVTMLRDKSGFLWMGTVDNGLSRLDPKTGKFNHYRHDPKNPKSLSFNNIASLHEDAAGNLWVGTWGGGLNKLDRETGNFKVYQQKDGLSSNSIFGILEDVKRNLWLSTPNGLTRFTPATGQTKIYTKEDGLQGNEFNPVAAAFQSSRHELMFGGAKGLNIFNPDSITSNPFVPPVQILNFQTLRKNEGEISQVSEKLHLSGNDSLTLSYKENMFSFEFAALSFSNPEENKYAYKLEGFDKDWIYAGERRFVTYTNLDPGTYIFRVKAANDDGVWNEEGTSVHLTILPPPWRTWWAYLLYVLAGIAILAALRKYWISRERLQNALELKRVESEKLQELDHLKTRFFTNISHEFRTPLTLILAPLEKWINDSGFTNNQKLQFYSMHRNAIRLLQLINQLLDIAKIEAGSMKLELQEQELLRFLKPVVFSFSTLAETRKIRLTFQSDSNFIPVFFDADKLEKIITNLISNALKFTPEDGSVTVSVSARSGGQEQELVQIKVQDTGIGIPEDRLQEVFNRFYQVDTSHTRDFEGSGIGLALTKELVQLHGGEISVVTTPTIGTCFTITLPLQKSQMQETEPSRPTFTMEPPEPLKETEKLKPTAEITTEEIAEDPAAPLLLVVEDNNDLRAFLRSIFEDEYRILEAPDGLQGLELALEQIPDLVISDLMMPELDGYGLTQKLKTDERTSHIPVILLTGKAAFESRLEGFDLGADDYITKPFHPRELQSRARNLVNQRKKLHERFSRTVKLEPTDIAITSADEHFLKKALAIVEANIANSEFDVEMFCKEIAMSRMQLHRKLKALTDQSTTEFIRTIRLKRAAALLEHHAGNVAEIGYQVGFKNLSYFSKCFKEMYGQTPSEYANQSADRV